MIVIWDNGGSYSDHNIEFYDCGDLSEEKAVAVVRELNKTDSDGEILALSGDFKCVGDFHVQTLGQSLWPHCLFDGGKPSLMWDLLPLAIIEAAHTRWIESLWWFRKPENAEQQQIKSSVEAELERRRCVMPMNA